jgi:hypothetical protein
MKLGEFIAGLSVKFNIDTTQPAFADILSSAVDVPDTVATLFNNTQLLTLDAAKNNNTLKMHFRHDVLGPIDRSLEAMMTEFQLPDEITAEIKGNNNTYERIPTLMRKLREFEAAKATAATKDKPELTAKINELNQKIAEITAAGNTAVAEKEKQHTEEMKDLILNSKIANRKLDTSRFPPELMLSIARQAFDNEVLKKGAKVLNENRNLVLKQAQDEGLDYYENSQLVTIDAMIDQVLATNKLIAVTDPNPATDNTQGQRRPLPPVPGANRSTMTSKLDIAMNDYQKGTV